MRRSAPIERSPRSDDAFRGFVAVLLPEALRDEIARVTAPLRGHGDVKWVAPENYHLTLKFLGRVPLAGVSELCRSLRQAAAGVRPFRLELAGVGAFPGVERPQVVWISLAAGHDRLEALAATTEEACGERGFARENRPFHAHLTLGRVQSPMGRGALTAALRGLSLGTIGAADVDAIHLMRSRLLPRGPIYSVEETFPLGADRR